MRFGRRPFAALAVALLAGCLEPQSREGLDAGEPQDEDAGMNVPSADASVPPDASGPVTFKLVTWNAENVFDDRDDPGKQDTVLTAAEVGAKVGAVAKVLKALKPDVVALQEIENRGVLNLVADAIRPAVEVPSNSADQDRSRTGYRVLVEAYDPRGIDVALLSRFPILKTVSHLGERLFTPDGRGPYYYSRDNLEVHLDVSGREVVVCVNHFISQVQSTDDYQRQAQANGTRKTADTLLAEKPRRPVIVAGDLNDDVGGPAISILLRGGAFFDVGADVTAAERWTFTYKSSKRRYDWLLPDKDTAALRKLVEIPHSAAMTTDIKAASDHFPVAVTFTLP
jgi:endonuclease/exonuclease/phosphatase family metal-dependent hydrolase